MLDIFSFLVIIISILCLVRSEPSSEMIFYLYDDESRGALVSLDPNGEVVPDIWEEDRPVKVLIHGWNSGERSGVNVMRYHHMLTLAKAYSQFDPTLNIILVDWTYKATTKKHDYFTAARATVPVGMEIANYLFLLKTMGVFDSWSMVHVLGHSLGAHVAGSCGNHVQVLENGMKIGRITGLDPAGPGFSLFGGSWPQDLRIVLDKSDAHFVDIIHTSLGGLNLADVLQGKLGSNLQAGHADFYPNGGKNQKQCNALTEHTEYCSHIMSVLFYAFSLKYPKQLTGCPCINYQTFTWGFCHCKTYPAGPGQRLGEYLSKTASGKYFLTLNDRIIIGSGGEIG